MIASVIKWSVICLFITLAYTDQLQPSVAGPVQEVGRRVVQAGEILFAGGCDYVFQCERIIKEGETLVENVKQ